MALNVGTLINDLKGAFNQKQWAQFSDKFATAIDDFIKSGEVKTTVTGTVTPPPPATPYQSVGNGAAQPGETSNITTTGKSAMLATISAKINSPSTVWADLGQTFGNAIDTNVKTGTVTTNVTGGLIGTGTGNAGCIDTSGTLSTLISNLTQAFTSQAFTQDWVQVAIKIADSVNTYLTGAIVTTNDKGTTPPTSWVGTGTGSIS